MLYQYFIHSVGRKKKIFLKEIYQKKEMVARKSLLKVSNKFNKLVYRFKFLKTPREFIIRKVSMGKHYQH